MSLGGARRRNVVGGRSRYCGVLSEIAWTRQKCGPIRSSAYSMGLFLRRAWLDLAGTIPTAAQARAFLQDPSPAKRTALIDRQPPSFMQLVMAEFIADGALSAHIRRTRLLYRDQRDALVAVLNRHGHGVLKAIAPDQGMHLVTELCAPLSDIAIESEAERAGIVVRAMSRLYRKAPPTPALMLGFSGFPTPIVAPAARKLADIVTRLVNV